MIELEQQNALEIQIDWEQYFRDFCEAHGRYYVMYHGTMLFPDGYRYSASDYKGPEWPAPEDKDKLRHLKLIYYNRRLTIVQEEYRKMDAFIKDLTNLQRQLSCPLSQRVISKDEDGKTVVSSQRLDIELLEKRLEWLKQDVVDCENMIRSLGAE